MGLAALIHVVPVRALGDLPQQVRHLDVRSVLCEQPRGPQPTVAPALRAFDLDHVVRVIGERVEEAQSGKTGPANSASARSGCLDQAFSKKLTPTTAMIRATRR